jgi:hypothetical protein
MIRNLLSLALAFVSTASAAYELGPELQLSREITEFGSVLPTIENTPDVAISGKLAVAAWALGERNIAWSYSTDAGASWGYGDRLPRPIELHGFSFPTICSGPSETFHIATHQKNSYGQETIALYKLTWQTDNFSVTGPELLVPSLHFNQGRYQFPRLASDPSSGDLYLSYTLFEGGTRPTHSWIYFMARLNGAWTTPMTLSDGASNGSSILVGPNQEVYVIWEDFAARKIVGRKSQDNGQSFGTPFVIGSTNENFTLPPGVQQDNRLNPLYPCSERDLAQNYPSVAVDWSSGPSRGKLYAVWSEQAVGSVTPTPVLVREVEPNGSPEQAMRVPIGAQLTGTATYVHGEGGEQDVFYFDGVQGETISFDGHLSTFCGGYFIVENWRVPLLHRTMSRVTDPPTPPVVFTIPSNRKYYFAFTGGGVSIGYNVRLRKLIVDPSSIARDHRDVVMASSADGGLTWSPKMLVNDDPPLFDNYLPRVAVDGLGGVHVAWYDRRDDPEHGLNYKVYWRYSGDRGGSFQPSIALSEAISVMPQSLERAWIGDYLALGATPNGAIALWSQMQTNSAYPSGTDQDINLRQVTAERAIVVTVDKLRVTDSAKWVRLTWRASSPEQIWSFNVFRSETKSGDYEMIGTVSGDGDGRGHYEYFDDDLSNNDVVSYRLQVVQTDAAVFWTDPISTSTSGGSGSSFDFGRLRQDSATGTVLLEIHSNEAGPLTIRIFDVRGAEVRTLHESSTQTDLLELRWDGCHNDGRKAVSGVYFVEATRASQRKIAKVILAR